MESGLEDRNNRQTLSRHEERIPVSMESGLEDRNNPGDHPRAGRDSNRVSMESGLEDRNNARARHRTRTETPMSQWSPA